MQSVSSRIWTRVTVSISYDDNHYTTGTSKVTFIPIVIGALDTVTKGLVQGLEDLEIRREMETIKTTALLRSARLLRRVLETWGDLLSLKLQWKTISVHWCEKLSRSNNNIDISTNIYIYNICNYKFEPGSQNVTLLQDMNIWKLFAIVMFSIIRWWFSNIMLNR